MYVMALTPVVSCCEKMRRSKLYLWGPHYWVCKPDLVGTRNLLVVQVDMPPGTSHAFHLHPGREEVLWIIEGQAEQWVDRDKAMSGPGDSASFRPVPPTVFTTTQNR